MKSATRLAFGPVLAFSLALLMAAGTQAQEDRAAEVFVAVDRAHAQLERLLIDLDAGASQELLYSEASTTLALLLTVQEPLKTLLGEEQWGSVRCLAEELYFQAEKGAVGEMRATSQALLERLTRLKEAVSAWREQGASLFIGDYGAHPNDKVSVPIFLETVPTAGVSAFNMELGFLPDVIEATSVGFPRGQGRFEIDNEAGKVLLSASGVGLTSEAPAPQTLADVRIRVKGQEKDVCLFSFRRVEVYGAGGEKIPSSGSNGSLRVLAPTGAWGEPAGEGGSRWVMTLVLAAVGVVVAGGLILIGVRLVLARR